ncbi:MAG: DUF4249 family protein [Verrucomicrobia bacterium]|nr:DUF4249 family protein [Prolixibacteraceae bacterium]
MKKIFIILIVLAVGLVACEEVYHPELMNVPNLPVIEARLSGDPAYNYIKLNYTTRFLDDFLAKDIPNAKIEVLEEGGPVYTAKYALTGTYSFTQPLTEGKRYKLKVTFDRETYESSWEMLPPRPEINGFHVGPHTLQKYVNNSYGKPILQYTPGFQVWVDIPAKEGIKSNLFRWHSILQFINPGSSRMASSQPAYLKNASLIAKADSFIWKSFYQTGIDNTARPARYTQNTAMEKHPLMFNTTNYIAYIDTSEYYPARIRAYGTGWIFEIDQYGLTEHASVYYQKITDQLKAGGRLFDPIYSQIQGNMTCTSNPEKQILGIFDLCSVTRHQYFVTNIEYPNIYFHKIEPVMTIPYEGFSVGVPPPFWQKPR